MTTPPHIERMEAELSELREKGDKLAAFVTHNPSFKGLSSVDHALLSVQYGQMRAYEATLALRLAIATA